MNYLDNAVQTLSQWVRENTAKGEAAPRFPLDTALIMVNDGIRRQGLEDLVLLNYHPTAAFRGADKWLDVERVARGLIFEKGTGRLIARPFMKFHNYGEFSYDKDIKNTDIESISYKEDGSLGIVFGYNGEWWVCTHGSLSSDQGYRATSILRKTDTSFLSTDFTYMTEIVYPENRIVTDYGDAEGLIYLDMLPVDINTPVDLEHAKLVVEKTFTLVSDYAGRVNFDLNNENVIQEIIDLCAEQEDYNFEGFVLTLKTGRKVKFKTDAYLKVHRCRFDVSVDRVKELLLTAPDTLTNWKETLPNEFFDEVDKIVKEITEYTNAGMDLIVKAVDDIFKAKDLNWNMNLKHVGRIIHPEMKQAIPEHLMGSAWTHAKGGEYERVYKQVMTTFKA